MKTQFDSIINKILSNVQVTEEPINEAPIVQEKEETKEEVKETIKLKGLTIHWAEGDESKYDKFPKTYTSWSNANKAVFPIYADNDGPGYNKVKFTAEFQNGEVYEGRLDVCEKEDNPFKGNVFGNHIKDYLDYLLNKCTRTSEESKKDIREFLNKYDLGFDSKGTPEKIEPVKVETEQEISEPVKSEIELVSYSEKALAVFGNTKPIKEVLKSLGGKFNAYLTNPTTKEKQAGWIFSKTKEQAIKTALNL